MGSLGGNTQGAGGGFGGIGANPFDLINPNQQQQKQKKPEAQTPTTDPVNDYMSMMTMMLESMRAMMESRSAQAMPSMPEMPSGPTPEEIAEQDAIRNIDTMLRSRNAAWDRAVEAGGSIVSTQESRANLYGLDFEAPEGGERQQLYSDQFGTYWSGSEETELKQLLDQYGSESQWAMFNRYTRGESTTETPEQAAAAKRRRVGRKDLESLLPLDEDFLGSKGGLSGI